MIQRVRILAALSEGVSKMARQLPASASKFVTHIMQLFAAGILLAELTTVSLNKQHRLEKANIIKMIENRRKGVEGGKESIGEMSVKL